MISKMLPKRIPVRRFSSLKAQNYSELYQNFNLQVEGVTRNVSYHWAKLFMKHDLNGNADGKIQFDEFRNMMSEIEFDESRNQFSIQQLFNILDANQSGSLNVDEFCKVSTYIQQGALN